MHNIEKERHKIFYVETQIRKNHKDEKNNPLVTGFTEMICQSLSVEIFLSKGKGSPLLTRGLFILDCFVCLRVDGTDVILVST